MNTAQTNPALSQLEDIVLPEQISQLPIAPGFWILALLIIVAIIATVIKFNHHRRYHVPRKAALAEFELLSISSPQYAVDINTLLKRVAMSYFPRAEFAKLDGELWYAWLGLRLPQNEAEQLSELLKKRYQKNGLTAQESQQLSGLTQSWLNKSSRFSSLAQVSPMTPSKQQTEAACSQ
ncbi:DUF4381 domain-containing protein [Shewanella olleyana]|uniref:DUF4381 domain-containing protein n=1 Tax=Shewanella olleyana TaxID=135626 RepID=UPI00200C6460|nr:DUF4381 domain-containing protein [Shewanella olleyana]MCL1068660.1 DUF4381 domain-containing protein [Shewanella olleyana]